HAALDRRRAADRHLAAARHGGAAHHPAVRDRRRGRGVSPVLVGAFACAHTPQLLARPETEDRQPVLRVHAAFARVKRRLEALRPDAIAMIAGDHIEAFFLNAVPALAVYVWTECAGSSWPRAACLTSRGPTATPRRRSTTTGGCWTS